MTNDLDLPTDKSILESPSLRGDASYDDGFEEKLDKMHDAFQSKVDTLLRYTDEVMQACSISLTASNVRHTPITKRIKSWESAKGSIRRQHNEINLRRRLRAAVEAKGRRWAEYCQEMGLQAPQTEPGPLETPADMFAALQDFGGLRISLYFPGEVKRVTAILQDRFQVIKATDKRQGSSRKMQRLQELIDSLQAREQGKNGIHRPADANDTHQGGFARTFSGYKATHFIVKLHEKDIPDDRRYAWRDIVVEVQVGTLVMHVWSEIEHDMIYKPLESQGEGISDDEERLLDLINGIVLTGEAALQQLEASTAKRLNQRASNKDATASSYFELAAWIEKDCPELQIVIGHEEWWLLDRLYAILKALGHHKHSDVRRLLKKVPRPLNQSRQTLPTHMLQCLCYKLSPLRLEEPPSDGFTIMALIRNARLWAIRLVHSLNLAIYLGVGGAFANIDVRLPRPTLVSFLEILHPDCPRYTCAESAETIANFCRAVLLQPARLPHWELDRAGNTVQLAKALWRLNIVLDIAGSTVPRLVMVPDMISRILPISDVSENGVEGYIHERELYGILDFIKFYLSHDGDNVDFAIHLWDRLTDPFIDRQFNAPVHQRFFVPKPPSQERNVGLWELEDFPMPLEVVKLDSFSMSQNSKDLVRRNVDDIPGPRDGVSHLASCLFPANQHEGLHKAWSMARALRRGKNPTRSYLGLPNSQSSTESMNASVQCDSSEQAGYPSADYIRDTPGREPAEKRKGKRTKREEDVVHPAPSPKRVVRASSGSVENTKDARDVSDAVQLYSTQSV